MSIKIGQLIKEIATKQGLTQKEFGEKINRTKQGVASIYNRSTIDVDLLLLISDKLDYDFFAHLYSEPPLLRFKERELAVWNQDLNRLNELVATNNRIIESKEEIIQLQKKYIAELEARLGK